MSAAHRTQHAACAAKLRQAQSMAAGRAGIYRFQPYRRLDDNEHIVAQLPSFPPPLFAGALFVTALICDLPLKV